MNRNFIAIFLALGLSSACTQAPTSIEETPQELAIDPVSISEIPPKSIPSVSDIYMASDAKFNSIGMEGLKKGRLQILNGCVVMVSEGDNTTYLALMPFGSELVIDSESEHHITIGTDKFNFNQVYSFTGGSVGKSLEGRGLFKIAIPKKCSNNAFSIGVIKE